MKTISVAISLSAVLLAQPAAAQTVGTPITTPDAGTTTRPILIPLAGSVLTSNGAPRTGQVSLHLALYASEDEREPLATEDQLITLGAGGTYQVWFGATLSEGLPANLFTESAARWVGVTVDQDPELPRTPIVTMPYAARAASADTLGNKTASDFVLSENLRQSLQKLGFSPTKGPKGSGPGDISTQSISTGETTTPNSIAKYIDNVGTLGEGAIVESGGNVGIGTASPLTKLHIFGTATQDAWMGLGPNPTGAGPSLNIGHGGASFGRGAGFFNVRPDSLATAPNPSLRFMTDNVERMIITNTGNVGIGTANPLTKLHIFGTPTDHVWMGIGPYPNGSGGNTPALNIGYGGGVFGRGAGYLSARPDSDAVAPNPSLRFLTASFERMIITNTGDVGIGLTAPQAKLSVSGTTTGGRFNHWIDINSSACGFGAVGQNVYLNQADNTWKAANTHSGVGASAIQFGTCGQGNDIIFLYNNASATTQDSPVTLTESMRIDAGTGNVGIGTSAPAHKLTIFADLPAFNVSARIQNANDAGYSSLWFGSSNEGIIRGGANAAAHAGQLVVVTATSPIVFSPYNAEAMRIVNGGVGIATTNPDANAKLHVGGNVRVDGNIAAKYQDVAEWVDAVEDLAAGTVVVIDPEAPNRVKTAAGAYDTGVAGAVSPQPGIVLGEAGPGRELVAQSGRVRVKVDASFGAIRAGDLLVTSATPGHAMRSVPLNVGGELFHRPGTIVGKALESLDAGRGEILVLLTLQ